MIFHHNVTPISASETFQSVYAPSQTAHRHALMLFPALHSFQLMNTYGSRTKFFKIQFSLLDKEKTEAFFPCSSKSVETKFQILRTPSI
jgi:hypothetical protein